MIFALKRRVAAESIKIEHLKNRHEARPEKKILHVVLTIKNYN